jgi:HlyD family type I secretion membrane fusion protein
MARIPQLPNANTNATEPSWRQTVGQALATVSPVGSGILSRLSDVIGGPAVMPTSVMPKGTAIDLDSWHAPLNKSIARPARVGMFVLIFLVGGATLWASTAPIASAVVASGLFVATGQNRIVQHLEGGIIRTIEVKEGDAVEAGQRLIVLDDTSAQADVRRLEIKQATLMASKARIDAEREMAPEVTYPPEVLAHQNDSEYVKIISSQNAVFASRREEFESQRIINESQIKSIEKELEGLKSQQNSASEQLALVKQELDGAQKLLAKGLTELPRVLQIRRNAAKFEGDYGQFVSAIGKAEQRILETKSELISMRSKIIADGADLYRQTTAELSDTEERLYAARGVLKRQVIEAPVRGIVVKLNYHTTGGVIGPGQPLMELLPTDEKLLVEASVSPMDITHVHQGLEAELRLTALSQRKTPLILGKVVYVSADKLEGDPRGRPGQFHYVARIELNEESVRKELPKDEKISPGMPAEVYIKTGERTMMEYLLKPITDSLHRAGRES